MSRLTIEITPGELIDRLAILELKHQHTSLEDLRCLLFEQIKELQQLQRTLPICEELSGLARRLYVINGKLWDVEDRLRQLEQAERFDSEFIGLARSVYRLNDERSQLKREVDRVLGWKRTEIKVYSGHLTTDVDERDER